MIKIPVRGERRAHPEKRVVGKQKSPALVSGAVMKRLRGIRAADEPACLPRPSDNLPFRPNYRNRSSSHTPLDGQGVNVPGQFPWLAPPSCLNFAGIVTTPPCPVKPGQFPRRM